MRTCVCVCLAGLPAAAAAVSCRVAGVVGRGGAGKEKVRTRKHSGTSSRFVIVSSLLLSLLMVITPRCDSDFPRNVERVDRRSILMVLAECRGMDASVKMHAQLRHMLASWSQLKDPSEKKKKNKIFTKTSEFIRWDRFCGFRGQHRKQMTGFLTKLE